jgi:rRNA maturation endonuclease Nob1
MAEDNCRLMIQAQLEEHTPFMSPYEMRCTACKRRGTLAELHRCAKCVEVSARESRADSLHRLQVQGTAVLW